MMDYACPICRSAASSQVQKLLVLQSKRLRIANNAPWYVGNRQIHEDLRTPFFADHIRALTYSFYTKLGAAGNPLVRQLGRHWCGPRADWGPTGNRGELTCSRPAEAVPKKTANLAQRVVPWLLGYLKWNIPCFSSVVRIVPKCNSKGAPSASQITEALSLSDPPPGQIAETFSQSYPNTSEFNSQKNHPVKILLK
jgi:hypothetical protein